MIGNNLKKREHYLNLRNLTNSSAPFSWIALKKSAFFGTTIFIEWVLREKILHLVQLCCTKKSFKPKEVMFIKTQYK